MPVSLDTIKRLVEMKAELRSQRQYEESDRVRDKLVRFGVRPPDYGTAFAWRTAASARSAASTSSRSTTGGSAPAARPSARSAARASSAS